MSAIISALDNYTPSQIGEKGSIEYTWSNSIRERIVQLSFQLTRSRDKETTYNAHEGGALPRDVIKVPALAGGSGKKERVDHPTQKPLNLCDTLIKASLNKNSQTLLVVPFVGSGSECVSAKKNNINFIGFEINKDYISIANERLEDN